MLLFTRLFNAPAKTSWRAKDMSSSEQRRSSFETKQQIVCQLVDFHVTLDSLPFVVSSVEP